MTNYRNQSACANCKFVLDIASEEESVLVCDKPPHTRPNARDYHGRVNNMDAWLVDAEEWAQKYKVHPSSVCDDWEFKGEES